MSSRGAFVAVAVLAGLTGGAAMLYPRSSTGAARANADQVPRTLVTEAASGISDPGRIARIATRHSLDVGRFGSEDALRAAIAATLSAQTPGDPELQAWYVSHRELFGGRTFEASRSALRQLVSIENTRKALGLSPVDLPLAAVE